jgi:hypothetical protein
MISGQPLYHSQKITIKQDLVSSIENYLRNHNLAKRGIEDGDKRKQLVGLIGEFSVIEMLTRNPVDLEQRQNGFDGGFDLIYRKYRIDVKTMERKSYVRSEYVNNFYFMQEKYETDIIVFCSYHAGDNVLEICGWIFKSELPQVGKFYAKETKRDRADNTSFVFRQDNYEVENKNLKPIKDLINIQPKL